MTKNEKVIAFLRSGKNLDVAAMRRLGVTSKSVRSIVRSMRSEGFMVYCNEDARGNDTFRIGRPSRAVVAAAYAAAPSLFE